MAIYNIKIASESAKQSHPDSPHLPSLHHPSLALPVSPRLQAERQELEYSAWSWQSWLRSHFCEFTQLIHSPCSSWLPSIADESFMSNFKFDHKYLNFLGPQMLYLLCGLVGTK